MQKKTKKILIITSCILAVMLPVVLVVGFFRYMPKMWQNKLEKEYLLQHRNIFRVQKVEPGAFNKFILHDVQIGSTQKPLFTSGRAELVFNSDLLKKIDLLPVKKLVLHDCRIKVDAVKRKIYVNDILLEEFVKSLKQLSPGTNSSPLELEVNALFSLGSKKPSAEIKLLIQNNNDKIDIKGFWHAADNKKISGSWQSFIDLSNDNISVSLADCMTEVFIQEILLRSGMPSQAAALLNKGVVSGSGSFSGSFRDLQIKELTYSGEVKNPELSFYKHKFKNIENFRINLQKNAKGIICKIPELRFRNASTPFLKNINTGYRKKITFSGECDFQQLAADYIARRSNLAVNAAGGVFEPINGEWNINSGIWNFSLVNNDPSKTALQFSIADTTFSLLPEKFELKANGKGSEGSVKQQIKFKKLEVYPADDQRALRSAQGIINTRTVFGSQQQPEQHTLSLNCSDFSSMTSWGAIELPGLSASMEICRKPHGVWDIFTSFSGLSGKFADKQLLILPVAWRGYFRLEIDQKKSVCQLKTLDFKSDELKLDHNKIEYTLPQVHIQLDGALSNKLISTVNAAIQAEKVIAEGLEINKPKLNFNYNFMRNGDKIQGSISCSKGVFPLSEKWFIKKAVDAKTEFALSDWHCKPEKFRVEAHLLDWQTGVFSGTLQNSKWQCSQEKDRSWNCAVDFDFMRMQSGEQKFGSGQFGKSSLTMNILLNPNGTISRLNLLGIMAQTSWLKGDYHIGSENVQSEIKFNNQSKTLLQGNVTLNNANILGTHLTASTPELKSCFTALDINNITGSISFAPGSISSTQGDLELRKAQFTLPLYISTKQPVNLPGGKITAKDVYFRQQREGSFTGTITHFMQLPAGVTDTLSHQITLDGKLAADKIDGKTVSINSTWLLPPEKDLIKWQFSMPESKLVQPMVLGNYLPLPVSSTALKGNFTLSGSLELSSTKAPAGVIKLNSINADWQIGNIAAEGVTAAGVLNITDNKFSLMPQDINAAKIIWNDILLLDNELNISVNSDKKLQIANWHGKYKNGKFRSVQIPSIELDKTDTIPAAKFTVSDMPLTEFFNTFGIKCIISDALVNGDIRLNTQDNKLYTEEAVLAFKEPAGKNLQLKLKNPSAVKMRDMQFRDFTMAVLNAMKCYQENFIFSSTREEIVMSLKAEGVPASPVPFVYQGRGADTPFRPATPGENGFAGEIELNVNLKLHRDNTGA